MSKNPNILSNQNNLPINNELELQKLELEKTEKLATSYSNMLLHNIEVKNYFDAEKSAIEAEKFHARSIILADSLTIDSSKYVLNRIKAGLVIGEIKYYQGDYSKACEIVASKVLYIDDMLLKYPSFRTNFLEVKVKSYFLLASFYADSTKSISILNKAFGLISEIKDKELKNKFYGNLMLSYGKIFIQQGNIIEGEKRLIRALDNIKKVDESEEYLIKQANIELVLSIFCIEQGKFEEALKYSKESLLIFHSFNNEIYRELNCQIIDLYSIYSDIASLLGNFDLAEKYLILKKNLLNKSESENANQHDIYAQLYLDFALINLQKDDIENAEKYINKASMIPYENMKLANPVANVKLALNAIKIVKYLKASKYKEALETYYKTTNRDANEIKQFIEICDLYFNATKVDLSNKDEFILKIKANYEKAKSSKLTDKQAQESIDVFIDLSAGIFAFLRISLNQIMINGGSIDSALEIVDQLIEINDKFSLGRNFYIIKASLLEAKGNDLKGSFDAYNNAMGCDAGNPNAILEMNKFLKSILPNNDFNKDFVPISTTLLKYADFLLRNQNDIDSGGDEVFTNAIKKLLDPVKQQFPQDFKVVYSINDIKFLPEKLQTIIIRNKAKLYNDVDQNFVNFSCKAYVHFLSEEFSEVFSKAKFTFDKSTTNYNSNELELVNFQESNKINIKSILNNIEEMHSIIEQTNKPNHEKPLMHQVIQGLEEKTDAKNMDFEKASNKDKKADELNIPSNYKPTDKTQAAFENQGISDLANNTDMPLVGEE